MRIIFTALIVLVSEVLFAQGGKITGRIVDAETLDPLPFAHVFIDQTTIGAVSDANGEYVIDHVENGDYKIVFSFVGYELYYASVSVNGAEERVSVRLIPTKEMLESILVKGTKDKEWEKQLKQFNKVFFGETEISGECRILNPWALDFKVDWEKTFSAHASEPLKIENKALGYSIECTLELFTFNKKKEYKIRGVYKFEEINTLDKREAAKWTRNRRMCYQNSLRFLFKSIVENHQAENGFELYADLRPELQTSTSFYFSNEIGKSVSPINIKDHIQPTGRPGFYKITLDNRLQIHHTTQFAHTKYYRDMTHPISWIEAEKGYIFVSQDGHIINSSHIVTSGEFNNNRIAAMLPLNYSPGNMVVINYLTKRARAKRLQERAYVQTDKGFYYPDEAIWFKTYLNYANQSLSDSLSRVIYVDLINPDKKILETKVLKLDSMYAWGDFQLAADLNPGLYYLRAYTKWMLNYGPEIIYYKPVMVLNKSTIVKSKYPGYTNDDFLITIAGNKFNGMGNIEVKTQLDSSNNVSNARCSITVTPIGSQLQEAPDIHEALYFPEEMPSGTLGDFTYPLEYGFSASGLLYRPNKKYTSGFITAIQGEMDSVYNIRTDRKGAFALDYLDFSGSVRFSFQATNKKGKPFGNIKLIEPEVPVVTIPKINLRGIELDTVRVDTPILIINNLAKEEIVKKKEEIESEQSATKELNFNPNADYVLGPNELARLPGGLNIIDALMGRVPGLQWNPTTGRLILGGRGSTTSVDEPLIVVDGVVLNMGVSNSKSGFNNVTVPENQQGTEYAQNSSESTSLRDPQGGNQPRSANPSGSNPSDMPNSSGSNIRELVGHITVEFVQRVEVMSSGDARYGSESSKGVIAIFTQKVPRMQNQSSLVTYTVKGFEQPHEFKKTNMVNLTNIGYSPITVYWNPSVKVETKRETVISFETPRNPGNYILKIEGISNNGVPVSGSLIFNIDKSLDQTKLNPNSDQRQKP